MSALFSWPTVTVGMGLPSAGGDGRRPRGEAPAHLICGVVLASASRSGGRVAPVVITGRCSGLRSGARPVVARNHLLSVHLHHAERTFSCCTCSTITEGTGE